MTTVPHPMRYPPPPASLPAYDGAAVWRAAVDNAAPHSEPGTQKPNGMTFGKLSA
jgi:hypothetical protein